jgi:3-methyladenine DNA glycosylase AlkC
MATALKHFFNPTLIDDIAHTLAAVHPTFDRAAFVADAVASLEAHELLGRARCIMLAMRTHLPRDYGSAVDVMLRTLPPAEEPREGVGMAPFRWLPHVMYVAEYGLDHYDISMQALHALTQRFTGEWAIRPFIERDPVRTLATLHTWTTDPSAHVRRLVSEGTRLLLPWAPQLKALMHDPRSAIVLLERLRDDPSSYVRRSVANNLNDLGKKHPALLFATCEAWLRDATPARRALVHHALRNAVKRGDREALRLVGAAGRAKATLDEIVLAPKAPRIGASVKVSFVLRSSAKQSQHVVVDLGVDFVKARGQTQRKVFKVAAVDLAPHTEVALSKTISLRQHTTRTHYPGTHAVVALLNGEAVALGAFTLRA